MPTGADLSQKSMRPRIGVSMEIRMPNNETTEFRCSECDFVAFSRNSLAGHLSGHARGGGGPEADRLSQIDILSERINRLDREIVEQELETSGLRQARAKLVA